MNLVHTRRAAPVAVALAIALLAARAASGAVWIHATTRTVAAGSSLLVEGAGGDMRVYLVPLGRRGYVTGNCTGCASPAVGPPQAPAILLGRAPGSATILVVRHFRLHVPPTAPPGRYRLALFCALCLTGPGGNVVFDSRVVSVAPR